MQIDDLKVILPPPPLPLETHGEAWSVVEKEIGACLPDDYKTFIEHYGSGRINSFIWVFTPFSTNRNINLSNQIANRLGALEILKRDFGEQCPYPSFPQNGGLLPFAVTDNGDVIYWIAEGDPNTWRVVVNESRGPKYEEFALSATDFLSGILTGKVNCAVFPKRLQKVGICSFEPFHSSGSNCV